MTDLVQERQVPPVPLPTYLWEEVRRSRKRGHYPWTHLYKLKSVTFDLDHEYEPISPVPTSPPLVRVTDYEQRDKDAIKAEELDRRSESRRSQRSGDRMIKVPNTNQIIIPLHGDSDEELNPDRYINPELVIHPDEEVDSLHTSTTHSGVHTSHVDSSGLERLPLQREAREPRAGIQERLRSQATRIRSRISNMSKPKMPPRPKIKIDRPKVKLPDKPKFLTEKPKFLTEKPKFLTEKPKFLTEKPKFLTEKPKFLTERHKFKLPDAPKIKLPEKPKFMEIPSFTFPRPGKTSSTKRPLRGNMEGADGKKNLFDSLKNRTYPRFLGKKGAGRGERAGTPQVKTQAPVFPAPGQAPAWNERYQNIDYADADGASQRHEFHDEEHYEENSAAFQDSYFTNAVRLDNESRARAKAESMSSMAAESDRHSDEGTSARRRAGVLEEIDADQFFLREKGLSREDVDVSRYLSLEIRDAFRSPKNALASLDMEYDYDEDDLEVREVLEPTRPTRSKSVKSDREAAVFNTFPMRPTRRKQSEPETLPRGRRSTERMEKPPRRFRSRNRPKPSSMPSLALKADESPPQAPMRRKSTKDLSSSKPEMIHSGYPSDTVPVEIMAQRIEFQAFPPMAPVRKSRSRGTSLADDDRTSRGAESLPSEFHPDDHHMRISTPDIRPMADSPISGRHTPSRPARSKSREAPGYATITKENKSRPARPPPPVRHRRTLTRQRVHNQFQNLKYHGKNLFFTYPRRAIRSLQIRPPTRPSRNYSTIGGPSRPPRRNRVFREPVYVDDISGPEAIISHVSEESRVPTSEIEDKDLKSGEVVEKMKGRPLPPPPRPPRKSKDGEDITGPEEKKALDVENIQFVDDDASVRNALDPALEDADLVKSLESAGQSIQEYIKAKREAFFNSLAGIHPPTEMVDTETATETPKMAAISQQTSLEVKTAEICQQTSLDVGEVNVSIQTDPLPEGFIVVDTDSISQRTDVTVSNRDESERSHTEEIPVAEVEQVVEAPHAIPSLPRQVAEEPITPVTAIKQEAVPLRSERLPYQQEGERPKLVTEPVRPIQEVEPMIPQRSYAPAQVQPPPSPTVLVQQIVPDKLHLAELEVDRLNVNEIQASKIVASEIESQTVQVGDMSSRSGNIVLNNIELPSELLQTITNELNTRSEAIAGELRCRTEALANELRSRSEALANELRTRSKDPSPSRPVPQIAQVAQVAQIVTPPPSICVQPSPEELAPQSAEAAATSPADVLPKPKTTKSKGRKSPTKIIDDSEDELANIMSIRRKRDESEGSKPTSRSSSPQPTSPSLPLQPSPPPNAYQLISQLVAIWKKNFADSANRFVVGVNAMFPEGEKRRDAQTATLILLVLVAGLFLLGFMNDHSIHHHHWDYVPPRL